MPIFMDRHDMLRRDGRRMSPMRTARTSKCQDRYGVKLHDLLVRPRAWLRASASSMRPTRPPPSGSIVRRMAKSPTPSFRSILPRLRRSSVASAIRRGAGGQTPAIDAGLRAVMFTDIVGSTEMTARLGDSAALELVRAHDALVRRGLDAHGGREVKHTGDGIMASFDEVPNAVRAAADIQRHFAAYNADASESLQRPDRHPCRRTGRGP